jgi:DNA-binding NtrC family response regulator
MAKRILKSVPIRILAVDPDSNVTESLIQLLSRQGYSVKFANSSDEALVKAVAFKPQLLIIDAHLSNPSEGIGLSNIILAMYPRAQVIFLTDRREGIRLSIKKPCGIISKPYDEGEMIDLVKNCIKGVRQSKSLLFY